MINIISDKSQIQKRISEIARLEETCFTDSWSTEALREMIENDLYFFVLSEITFCDGNHVCGYLCGTNICGECEIQRICVDHASRKQGIGYMMLNHVMTSFKADSYFLEVNENNVPAVSLYHKAGFESYHVRKNYYGPGENALLMRKQA